MARKSAPCPQLFGQAAGRRAASCWRTHACGIVFHFLTDHRLKIYLASLAWFGYSLEKQTEGFTTTGNRALHPCSAAITLMGIPLTHEFKRFSEELFQKPTITGQVKGFLRELIISGKLQSGERIIETRIAQQLSIGQPTVREALESLQDEGLVIRHPNRGCTVVELSAKEIRQIFRLRIEWEALAVDLAMENWTAEKAEQLARALEQLESAAAVRDAEKYYRNDLEFHRTIWRSAENPFLLKALAQITIPLFAFVMIKVARDPNFDLIRNAAGHRRMAEAILSGDRVLAVQLTRQALGSFQHAGSELLAES
jgi:DNA-binding GntR family transcriptional regulator